MGHSSKNSLQVKKRGPYFKKMAYTSKRRSHLKKASCLTPENVCHTLTNSIYLQKLVTLKKFFTLGKIGDT